MTSTSSAQDSRPADGLPVSGAGFVDAFRRHFGRSPGAYARGDR